MHEYTCAVVSVLILCFFLVLRIFWEEQLAEQFWYFNFSLYLVVFWAEQSKKHPVQFFIVEKNTSFTKQMDQIELKMDQKGLRLKMGKKALKHCFSTPLSNYSDIYQMSAIYWD